MITVGILATNPVWEENLSAFTQGAPFRITGRTDDLAPEKQQCSSLIDSSDAIWIPEFTPHSIEAAIFALRQSRHVLLGFPVLTFQNQITQLVNLSREANVDVQVGHHDRYHPAFRAVKDQVLKPRFIRLSHQMGQLLAAENENFLLQQILYDVDAVLALIPEQIKKVNAHISKITPDTGRLIDIRLEFHNGSAASITFSNLGFADQRRIEITDYCQFFTLDLMSGQARKYTYSSASRSETQLWPVNGILGMNTGQIDEESLTRECVSYFQRKASNQKPLASIEEGYEALQITQIICKKIGVALA